MIRLTINAQTEPEIHLFNKSVILIGSESSQVDLFLPDLNLQSVHLKILQENGQPTLINFANDPFVSIDGHPFGKKTLFTGNIISIQDKDILFENLQSSSEATESPITSSFSEDPDSKLPNESITQHPSLPKNLFFSLELPFENEVAPFQEDEFEQEHTSHYLRHESTSSSSENKEVLNSVRSTKKATSLKDDYLRDLEDENQVKPETDDSSHLYHAWKWILLFILSIFIIAGIVGAVIYLTVSDKTEAQEVKAAQGMADIAMALTHAQLYELKPHNQNWSDVDFLKDNLQTILPKQFSYAAELDSHGQFNLFPYSLRIYTNSNLSNFLLIAQPAPSFLQWLIPKSIILIDSHSLELRTTKDIRGLNRLLANPSPLDGVNSKEIFTCVKQCQLLRLDELTRKNNPYDFALPNHPALIKSETEHVIYNAPRYFRFGNALIQKAIDLTTLKTTSQEVIAFKRDVENFSRLHNLILYTDQGREIAFKIKQGLQTFAPNNKITLGFLEVDKEGKIQTVDILQEGDLLPINEIAHNSSQEELRSAPIKEDVLLANKPAFDVNHPVYVQLAALVKARETELKSLALPLKEMLDSVNSQLDLHYKNKFEESVHHYLHVDAEHKNAIKKSVTTLYKQYEEVPIEQFLLFINESGCGRLMHQLDTSLILTDENFEKNLEDILNSIDHAESLVEVDGLIAKATSYLTFDYIKNSNELIKYQNFLRNRILSWLETFFSSSNFHLNSENSLIQERIILQNILSYIRIIKPEEREFFLKEFDSLTSQHNDLKPQSAQKADEKDEKLRIEEN